jgi:hypothetical protein
MSQILGIIASGISGSKVVTNSFESISTVTVGSGGTTTISFTSIASTWTHLQLRGIAQSARATYSLDGMLIRFNSDSGSNYSFHYLRGNGAAAQAGGGSSTTNATIDSTISSTAAANVFGGFVIDILDYANTNKYKTIRSFGGFDVNGTVSGVGGYVVLASGNWRNTNAITSISITTDYGSDFQNYSHFALYGIKS